MSIWKLENCGEIATLSVAEEFGLKWFEYVGRLVHSYSPPHLPLAFISFSLWTALGIKLHIANH